MPTPTAIPGCGTGEAGFSRNSRLVPHAIAFGGATLEFTTAMIAMRDGSYWADDAIPGGIGLTPDERAVVVGPGEHIVLRAAGAVLSAPNVAVGRWAGVTFDGLANLPAAMVAVPWRLRSDGSISISAPEAAGDWVVSFTPTWETTCLRGDGTAYGRIKVRT